MSQQNQGFAPLPRKWMNNPLVRKRPEFTAFLAHCCYRARWRDGWLNYGYGAQHIFVERGAFLYGRSRFASDTGLSEQQLKTCVRQARELGLIRKIAGRSTSHFTYFKIPNYPALKADQPALPAKNNQHFSDEKPPKSTSTLPKNQPAHSQKDRSQVNVSNQHFSDGEEHKSNQHLQQHFKKSEKKDSLYGNPGASAGVLKDAPRSLPLLDQHLKNLARKNATRGIA